MVTSDICRQQVWILLKIVPIHYAAVLEVTEEEGKTRPPLGHFGINSVSVHYHLS